MQITCPHCGHAGRAPDHAAGKVINCPACKKGLAHRGLRRQMCGLPSGTRETELAEVYPIHVVCCWLGHAAAIAQKHYLQVTEDHFALAADPNSAPDSAFLPKTAQNTAQHRARTERAPNEKTPENTGVLQETAAFSGVDQYPQGDSNPLPVQHKGKRAKAVTETPPETLAQTLARETKKGPDSCPVEGAKIDPDLARLVDAWPSLAPAVKRMILAALEGSEPR